MFDPGSWYVQTNGYCTSSEVQDPTTWDPRHYEGTHKIVVVEPEPTGAVEMTVVEIEIGADLVEKLWGPGAREEWLEAVDKAGK